MLVVIILLAVIFRDRIGNWICELILPRYFLPSGYSQLTTQKEVKTG